MKQYQAIPAGGNAMFALLALGGDLGCAGGPTFAGLVAGAAGDSLRIGILAAVWFPALLAILLLSDGGPEALVDVQEEDWTWPKRALQVPALSSKGHRQLAYLLSFLV